MKPIDSLIAVFGLISHMQKRKQDPLKYSLIRLYHTKTMHPLSEDQFYKMTLNELLDSIEQKSISYEITKSS